jgi:hypothetical protein
VHFSEAAIADLMHVTRLSPLPGAVQCSEADLADLRAAKDALQAALARAKPAEPMTQ